MRFPGCSRRGPREYGAWASLRQSEPLSCEEQVRIPSSRIFARSHLASSLPISAEGSRRGINPGSLRRAPALGPLPPVIQQVPNRFLERDLRTPPRFPPNFSGIPNDLRNLIGTEPRRIRVDLDSHSSDHLEIPYDVRQA